MMTRMWMTSDPKTYCKNHLLGSHKEIHQLLGTLVKKMRVGGYIKNNCIEILSMKDQHDKIVAEMIRRGWSHHSDLISQEEINEIASYLPKEHLTYKIDVKASDQERYCRCEECRKRRDSKNETNSI